MLRFSYRSLFPIPGGKRKQGREEKSRRHALPLHHHSYLLRQHWQREKEIGHKRFVVTRDFAKQTLIKFFFSYHCKNTRACKSRGWGRGVGDRSKKVIKKKRRERIPRLDAETQN